MPGILAEVSFVSSPTDEQKLQSDGYREKIAESFVQRHCTIRYQFARGEDGGEAGGVEGFAVIRNQFSVRSSLYSVPQPAFSA